MARGRFSRFRRRFRRFRSAGGFRGAYRRSGGFRGIARRGRSAVASRYRRERQDAKRRLISGVLGYGYGMAERNGMLHWIPAVFDDPAHTVALVSAVLPMVVSGSIRTLAGHVADTMVPVSGYKLGTNGFDPRHNGTFSGALTGSMEAELAKLPVGGR